MHTLLNGTLVHTKSRVALCLLCDDQGKERFVGVVPCPGSCLGIFCDMSLFINALMNMAPFIHDDQCIDEQARVTKYAKAAVKYAKAACSHLTARRLKKPCVLDAACIQ